MPHNDDPKNLETKNCTLTDVPEAYRFIDVDVKKKKQDKAAKNNSNKK